MDVLAAEAVTLPLPGRTIFAAQIPNPLLNRNHDGTPARIPRAVQVRKRGATMRKPDVMVTVEGGVAQVDVFKPGIVVEVRDFDVEGADATDKNLWTNEEGDRCWRYFVGEEQPPPTGRGCGPCLPSPTCTCERR